MKWEVVKIKGSKMTRTAPYASVGFGRICLSSAACELVDDFGKYKYAIFMKSRKDGAPCVGVKLVEDFQENSFRIIRRKYNGRLVENSFTVDNKFLVETLFGVQGANKESVRYSVMLDDEDKSIIVISAR